jgi:hypothetical protein
MMTPNPTTCPICAKELAENAPLSATFPFCSHRCQAVDLYRWMNGRYAIVETLSPDRLMDELAQCESVDADDAPSVGD